MKTLFLHFLPCILNNNHWDDAFLFSAPRDIAPLGIRSVRCSCPWETRCWRGGHVLFDELYDLAVAEGGQLVVRAGGDEKNQQASTVQAFQEKFPKINITLTVDLSKVIFSCSPRLWINGISLKVSRQRH